jgi:hypothetical protein
MGHRGYTNRAKSGSRAAVSRRRQAAARAVLAKQRQRVQQAKLQANPKTEIVIESERHFAEEEGGPEYRASSDRWSGRAGKG